MIHGMDITSCARSLPKAAVRVFGWTGRGKRWRWAPVTWRIASDVHGTGLPGFYLDCGTGPVQVSHWAPMLPNPED